VQPAIELAARGADVVLLCRDPTRGAAVLDEVGKTGPGGAHRMLAGDLADPDAVRALAAQIRQDTDQLHALVHTAAALTHERQDNRAGHELMFASNVLGRFLLTHQLLPLLQRGAPARVLVVTGPAPDRLDFDDLMARTDFKPFAQFRATNAANLLFAFELARRLHGTGVTANAYHPGALQSDLMRQMPAMGAPAHLACGSPPRQGRPCPWRAGAGRAVRAGHRRLLQARNASQGAQELPRHRRPAATVDRVPAAVGHRLTVSSDAGARRRSWES
jgi:NAD(P)-dependent dehydrogenase (short-subunit alcohol dehydrogenase family)